jgi:ribose 5-phosphate isomerase A
MPRPADAASGPSAAAAALDAQKRAAAERALELVRDGMLLGIGTGSTATHFIEGLGRLVREGMRLRCVSSSERSSALAAGAGVEILTSHERRLDLAVDGADEIAPDLGVIKGGGGALLREKLVALAADRFVVIADETKLVPVLGRRALPVEVVRFLWQDTARRLAALGLTWELRGGEAAPFVTDEGHHILDVRPGGGGAFADPPALAGELDRVVGVVEHGFFLGMAQGCVIGTPSGVSVLGSLG